MLFKPEVQPPQFARYEPLVAMKESTLDTMPVLRLMLPTATPGRSITGTTAAVRPMLPTVVIPAAAVMEPMLV